MSMGAKAEKRYTSMRVVEQLEKTQIAERELARKLSFIVEKIRGARPVSEASEEPGCGDGFFSTVRHYMEKINSSQLEVIKYVGELEEYFCDDSN